MIACPEPDRIDLSRDLSEVMRMNTWFEGLAARHALPAPLAGDVKLCLNEAVTNVLSYAFDGTETEDVTTAETGEATAGRVQVALAITPATVTAVIRDDGVAFDPCAVADPERPADIASAEIGGLGIKLIRETSTAMGYAREDGWNVLTLRFDRARDQSLG